MDNTHSSDTGDNISEEGMMNQHPAEVLAALDPADAPAVAEKYAYELATELEKAGAAPAEPVQLQADLGDETTPETRANSAAEAE